jgi:hypothetical protein
MSCLLAWLILKDKAKNMTCLPKLEASVGCHVRTIDHELGKHREGCFQSFDVGAKVTLFSV